MGRGIRKFFGMGLCIALLTGCGQAETLTAENAEQQQSSVEASQAEQTEDGNEQNTTQSEAPAGTEAGGETETENPSESGQTSPEPDMPHASIQENRTTLNETIYDDVLNPIGTVLSRQIVGYSEADPERVIYKVNITWPEIDVSFAGADKINETMLEYVDKSVAYMERGAEDYENVVPSFSSSFDGFSYRDDHYISFIQSEYDYEGGAHGMPYWEPFTFQLQSGQQLVLSDIIGNSEEELKDIVTKHFAEMINAAPEDYWENAEELVREEISLASNFVLTPEGIKFYFLPYDIAPYAAGFPEVTVPYEEFDMKI